MPRVEFEHTIRVFERAKTVHALVRSATVICKFVLGVVFCVLRMQSVKIGSDCTNMT
jgi:hypothetical protein